MMLKSSYNGEVSSPFFLSHIESLPIERGVRNVPSRRSPRPPQELKVSRPKAVSSSSDDHDDHEDDFSGEMMTGWLLWWWWKWFKNGNNTIGHILTNAALNTDSYERWKLDKKVINQVKASLIQHHIWTYTPIHAPLIACNFLLVWFIQWHVYIHQNKISGAEI